MKYRVKFGCKYFLGNLQEAVTLWKIAPWMLGLVVQHTTLTTYSLNTLKPSQTFFLSVKGGPHTPKLVPCMAVWSPNTGLSPPTIQ
jgi:hypothetical protein